MPDIRHPTIGDIELAPAHGVRWERNALDPSAAYDVRCGGRLVAQLLRDDTRLDGVPSSGAQWVLVQKDREYVLGAAGAQEAKASARRFVAARLGGG